MHINTDIIKIALLTSSLSFKICTFSKRDAKSTSSCGFSLLTYY